jgi:hypothetical protein
MMMSLIISSTAVYHSPLPTIAIRSKQGLPLPPSPRTCKAEEKLQYQAMRSLCARMPLDVYLSWSPSTSLSFGRQHSYDTSGRRQLPEQRALTWHPLHRQHTLRDRRNFSAKAAPRFILAIIRWLTGYHANAL